MKKIVNKIILLSSILFILVSCSSTKDLKYRRVDSKSDGKTWVVAHRGLTGKGNFPENSIATIQSCIEENLEIIEIDIRKTKDNQLVIIHDKTLDRTTNGKGKVSDYTLAELKELRLVHNGQITSYQIPTLDEVFKVVKNKILVDLDIKLDSIEDYKKIADLINKHKINKQMIVFLYDKGDIPAVNTMFYNVNIMPRARSLTDIRDILKYSYINIIHIDEDSYDNTLMKELIQENKRIWLNTLGEYDKLESSGQYGFKQFFATYPNVNVVQTDLGVQLKKYLSQTKK